MQYFIGCSGFYYDEWKGIFYPDKLPKKDRLHFYAQHFNSVEINSSFYRNPSPKSLQNWYHQTPEHFLFSLKAPRDVTHYKRFVNIEEALNLFYKNAEQGLKEKLGCILFQLPPAFEYSNEHLELILHSLNPGFRNVVEFRNHNWWQQNVSDAFAEKQIVFCGIDYPGTLPKTVVNNTGTVYYRFHGNPVLYKSLYEKEKLEAAALAIKQAKKDAFIFFNNTWGQAALQNACEMQQLMK